MADQRPNDSTPPLYVSPEAAAIAGEVDGPSKPVWPKVIGIISIVLSVGSLLCLTGGSAIQAAGIGGGGGQGFTKPPMSVMMYANIGIISVLNIVLLIAGILLLSRNPVSRPLFLADAFLKIPVSAWGMVMSLAYNAKMFEAMRGSTVEQEARAAEMMGKFMYGIAACFSLPGFGWPVFLLIWFLLVKRKPSDISAGVAQHD